MSNQVIGIALVFAITAFLLMLRHLLVSFGRPRKDRHFDSSTSILEFSLNRRLEQDDSLFVSSADRETVHQSAELRVNLPNPLKPPAPKGPFGPPEPHRRYRKL